MVVEKKQEKFNEKQEKDFARLPKLIQDTVMGYVTKGFWFLELIADNKTHWLLKLAQYHFIEDKKGKPSKKGWVHEYLYKAMANGEMKLARVTTIQPDGKEIYRRIIEL